MPAVSSGHCTKFKPSEDHGDQRSPRVGLEQLDSPNIDDVDCDRSALFFYILHQSLFYTQSPVHVCPLLGHC